MKRRETTGPYRPGLPGRRLSLVRSEPGLIGMALASIAQNYRLDRTAPPGGSRPVLPRAPCLCNQLPSCRRLRSTASKPDILASSAF